MLPERGHVTTNILKRLGTARLRVIEGLAGLDTDEWHAHQRLLIGCTALASHHSLGQLRPPPPFQEVP
jgi:hypothetical protein